MSKLKPILFNTSMVQAILEGRKTTTRRIVKTDLSLLDYDVNDKDYLYLPDEYGEFHHLLEYSPYKIGDILYVRETWCRGKVEIEDTTDGFQGETYISQCIGDEDIIFKQQAIQEGIDISETKWKPSIFMPKEATRIFLKVTNVKVERLQDITEEGARQEGADHTQKYYFPFRVKHDEKHKKCLYDKPFEYGDYRTTFAQIWDDTLNKNDKLAWMYEFKNNPYVWVIEFERISKEEALNG